MDNQVELNNLSKQDILNRIREYAGSYTPEWNLSFDNPDVGAALAMIFAEQLMDNIEYYNAMLDRYHEVFTRMLGISPYPPKPASAVVIVKLIENAVPGIFLQAGTKFTADSEGEHKIIFESQSPVYITESSIDTIFMVSRNGEYQFILGEFEKPSVDRPENERIQMTEKKEFALFDFGQNSFWEHELLIYHGYLFGGNRESIRLKFKSGDELLAGLEEQKFRLFYRGDGGIKQVYEWKREGEDIILSLPQQKSSIDMIMIKAEKSVEQSIWVGKILLSAEGQARNPDFVCSDTEDCAVNRFRPFGESISLYAQCHIGCNDVFSKKGAVITLEFDVDYGEYFTGGHKKKEDLRIIKRRNYAAEQEYISDTYADMIAFEYYTGKGWKRLEIPSKHDEMFGRGGSKRIKISFPCPRDWEAATVGAHEGKCLRIRVTRAENCYLQPCIHHYPVIYNMTISYSYEGNYITPDRLETISNMKKNDITNAAHLGQMLPVFDCKKTEAGDRLYLGFEKKIEGGPVGLWIQKKEERMYGKREFSFWYYGEGTWKRLKVIDHTEQFAHSGMIFFIPPSGMEKTELYGQERYCICIENQGETVMQDIISDIRFNGVEVMNIETGEEEDYYIDVSKPNMEFMVSCRNLLGIDVWVNEYGEHSDRKMREMIEDMPERVHAEFNYLGEITNFYVKWKETDNFEREEEERAYRLNRRDNKIVFGDGVHNRIPKVTGDVAFKLTAYRCYGMNGNVGSGKINDTRSNILYVDRVFNPQSAYGGSRRESREMTLSRGAGLISSHGRLITEKDYIREIRGFSDCIDKVRCIHQNNAVTILLLMKDYNEGVSSFYRIRDELKKYIIDRCDLSILPEQIHIIEPVFIELHTKIWLKTKGMGDTFELASKIKKELTKYLDPVKGHDGAGWEPGIFPKYSQMIMKINTLKKDAVVKKVLVTARYQDESGVHECALEKIMNRTLAVVTSGEHHVYTE